MTPISPIVISLPDLPGPLAYLHWNTLTFTTDISSLMVSFYHCWQLILHKEIFIGTASSFREVLKKKKKSQSSYESKSGHFLPGTKFFEKLGKATGKEGIYTPNSVLKMPFAILFEKISANNKVIIYTLLHHL